MFVPEEDGMFYRGFKGRVNPEAITREVAANLEDVTFAEAVVDACLEILRRPAEACLMETAHNCGTEAL